MHLTKSKLNSCLNLRDWSSLRQKNSGLIVIPISNLPHNNQIHHRPDLKMVPKMMILYIFLNVLPIYTIKAQDYDGAAPPPQETDCNGIFLTYTFISRTREYPHLKNVTAQPWAFKSTATVLNAGLYELKNWKIFIGFQNQEILVSASNAVIVDGNDLPAPVGNGTTLSGYPQTDLKTSVETAGDLTQIQAEIELSGTHFGIRPSGHPMPRTIKLENDGYKCPAPKRSGMYEI